MGNKIKYICIGVVTLIIAVVGVFFATRLGVLQAFEYLSSEELGNTVSRQPKEVEKCMDKIGVSKDSRGKDFKIDMEFMQKYIKKHSKDDLFKRILALNDEIKIYLGKGVMEYNHDENNCMCINANQMLKDMLMLMEDDIEFIPNNLDLNNAEGFYSQNANINAEPQAEVYEETGKFYSSTGENVHYETKTNEKIVEYHGDFAISRLKEWSYNEGKYEWIAGEFKDELPHWTYHELYSLYYKGECICTEESRTALLSTIKQIQLVKFKNDIYKFSPSDFLEEHKFTYGGKLT